ncbi:unnamed protein product [Closterium sp. NIES-54]
MRVAKYLGQTPTVGLQYSAAAQWRQKGADGVEPGRLFLTAFSDASYASEPEDMTSVGGFICCVGGGPTAWESKKQVDQALSSVESEYMALFRGTAGAGSPTWGTGAVPAVPGVAARPRPYFVPLLQQVLGPPPPPSLERPLPVQSQLQPASPLPAPSPYTVPTGGLTERRAPASRPASPVRHARTSGRGSRQLPPPVPGTHRMSLRPSTAPLRVPLPSPPESSLPAFPDPASDYLRAASPTVARLLATAVTDPSFESSARLGARFGGPKEQSLGGNLL